MATFISGNQTSVGSKVKAEMTNCKCTHICTHTEKLYLKGFKKRKKKNADMRRYQAYDKLTRNKTHSMFMQSLSHNNNKKPLASSFSVFLYLLTLMTSYFGAPLLEKQFYFSILPVKMNLILVSCHLLGHEQMCIIILTAQCLYTFY